MKNSSSHKKEKLKENSTTAIIAMVFVILFILGFVFFWIFTSNQISDFKDEYREDVSSLLDKSKKDPFYFVKDTIGGGKITLSSDQVEELMYSIKAISNEVYRETNRAESIIDKDIDRLNLFMSMGIGFMALLGVFVPILVNLNTTNNLKDNQKDIRNGLEDIKNDSKDLKSRTIKLQEQTSNMLLQNANSSLQSAVGRFYYVGQLHLYNSMRSNDLTEFEKLVTDIKNSLRECQELQMHKVCENEKFKTHVDDFIFFLHTERVRLNMILNKRVHQHTIDELIENLENLKNCEESTEKEHYNAVYNSLDSFVNTINGDVNTRNK